jgi:hypothetical protein
MPSSGMLHLVALIRTDVSEDCSASIMRVTRIGELGATLVVTSNGRKLQGNTPGEKNSGIVSICSQHATVASYR